MRVLSLLLLVSSLLSASIELPEHFQADFIQKITNTKQKEIVYSGEVRFSNGSFFKWSYKEPTKKEVCTDGLEILVVDHDLEQVSAYIVSNDINIAEILKKAKPHRENVYVAEYENKQYTIQLDKQQKLHSIAYYDDLDNKVQIIFKHMKYGKGNLPSESMKCNYPESYDRIQG